MPGARCPGDPDPLRAREKGRRNTPAPAPPHAPPGRLAPPAPLPAPSNRRFGLGRLREEFSRAVRAESPLGLLMIDLDHFKNVNDTHGHLVGSKLLAEVGQMLKSACRRIDFAFRYGGDEFVIVLPQASKGNACIVAMRLHRLIGETLWLASEGLNIRITASVGLASYPSDAKTKVELLHLADEAMYQVKNTTRDGVAAAKMGVVPAV